MGTNMTFTETPKKTDLINHNRLQGDLPLKEAYTNIPRKNGNDLLQLSSNGI